MRIVLLSQFAMIRTALRHMLSSASDVEIAGDADLSGDIQEIITNLHPDVVLVETADNGSASLVRAIEKISEAGNVPVVVLAGNSAPSVIRSMLRAGVTGYVLKQSTDTELLLALRTAAHGRRFLDSSLIDAMAFEDTLRPASEGPPALSKRQSEVLRYIVQGFTSGEIARKLGVSVKTVETYRSRIYDRLEVRSRAGLMQYAVAAGLISIHDQLADNT